jgi:hypothetical protein
MRVFLAAATETPQPKTPIPARYLRTYSKSEAACQPKIELLAYSPTMRSIKLYFMFSEVKPS